VEECELPDVGAQNRTQTSTVLRALITTEPSLQLHLGVLFVFLIKAEASEMPQKLSALAVFQKTQIQFLTPPQGGSQPPLNIVPGDWTLLTS
jgi:hypothetical protein